MEDSKLNTIKNAPDLITAIAIAFNLLRLGENIKINQTRIQRNLVPKTVAGAEIILYDQDGNHITMIMWNHEKNHHEVPPESQKKLELLEKKWEK